MLRLTLKSPTSTTSPVLYEFDQPLVLLGAGETADIALPDESLLTEHVKIIQEGKRYIAINCAHDPFATLNSLPFGKKTLTNQDILQIGKTEILIEFNEVIAEEPPPVPTPSVQIEIVDKELSQEMVPASHVPVEPTPVKEIVEPLVPASTPKIASKIKEKEHKKRPPPEKSLKYKEKESQPILSFSRHWQILLSILIVIFSVMTIFSAKIFVNVLDETDKEKITAAVGVADVAMALAYAQVHHIKPEKQNWFDPEFLKNNLTSVLSSEYPSFAHIDNLGQFTNCPYILRIYTSSDLSQFLVIAQPEPSLLQWLIPKSSIIVDSNSMEMHNINDLKALNRLLVNPYTLDGANAIEISSLVKAGDLIPLSTLASVDGNQGFSPPKALGLVHPGAENLIYNAPRYYHFGESFIKRAIQILQMTGNSHEITRLQQEIAEISKFPNIVLYSSQGIHKAIQAQKALAAFAPNSHFFTAYLNFNNEGLIANSHLVLKGDHAGLLSPAVTISPGEKEPFSSQGEIAYQDPISARTNLLPQLTSQASTDSSEANHTLLLQLTALTNERKKALASISNAMIILLNKNTESGISHFSESFFKLLAQYEQLDREHQTAITKALLELYYQYPEMPLDEFTSFIKQAGLELFINESLLLLPDLQEAQILSQSQIAEQMQKIKSAVDFAELDHSVKETAELLNLSHIPNPDELILYQNEMRGNTLERLGEFMFSPKSLLPTTEFCEENRALLSHILKTAWVTDPDEYDFYLNEFELLKDQE